MLACLKRRSGTVRLTDRATKRAIEDAARGPSSNDITTESGGEAWLEASELDNIREEARDISIGGEPTRSSSDTQTLPVHRGKSSRRKLMSTRGESSDSVSEVALDSPDETSESPKFQYKPSRRRGEVSIELPSKKGSVAHCRYDEVPSEILLPLGVEGVELVC